MHVPLSQTVEDRLRTRAARQGISAESYASQLIEEAVSGPQLKEFAGSILGRFEQSGMNDEELGEMLETEKHAARKERQS